MKKTKERILITGISGSGGSYLAEHFLEKRGDKVEVHGIARWHSAIQSDNLEKICNDVTVHECDLTDFSSIYGVLCSVCPDKIFHLASSAKVLISFSSPLAVLQNNIMGTANLLEAVRISGLKPKILMCSTSEVYGQVDPRNVPISENCPINPINPYAVSKMAQDQLSYVYFKGYNIHIVRTRMFTYLNPRRTDLFATSFAKQVARIEAGLQDVLDHGNLDSIRTIIDVRDAMSAYCIALDRCEPGEIYNIGGTKTMKVGDFLEILKKMAKCPIPCRLNPDLLRPTDVTLQIPDTTKFRMQTGWSPQYSFEDSTSYLLEFWRKEARKG